MTPDEKLPAVRPVDVMPFQNDSGDLFLVLHDPTQLTPRPFAVSVAGYFVIAHCDGQHTLADVQRAFEAQTGEVLGAEVVEKLVQALDDGLLLENERTAEASARRRAAYMAGPVRDNRDRQPAERALRAEIKRVLSGGVAAPVADVRGIIAPHLDYGRGAPCYADAYATLAAGPDAERFVILGTNHFGASPSAVATRKDFLTPLGQVAVDREFIGRLEARVGASLCEHEFDHAYEHSVELQVHVLQTIMSKPFAIVPVLCPDICGATGTASCDGTGVDLRVIARALGELLEDGVRTIVIAGADLSHVGQRFRDTVPTTRERLQEVAEADCGLLALLAERREDEFAARLTASGNVTRICSAGCILALLQALPGRPCQVLRYHQAASIETETTVTCAAAVVG